MPQLGHHYAKRWVPDGRRKKTSRIENKCESLEAFALLGPDKDSSTKYEDTNTLKF